MQKYTPSMMGGVAHPLARPPGQPVNKNPAAKPVAQLKDIKKLRVPKNLVKRYNVMRIKAPRPIKFGEIKEANMIRKSKKQVFAEEDVAAMPTHGAGSVYNYERKEEARKKRRGYMERKINTDSLPYALRLGGKGGKRYTGKKEPNLVNASYYILTQCPDGVFEAVPVQAWYNFLPDIDYATMSSEEVEHEFSKRSRALQDFNEKYNFGMMNMYEEPAPTQGMKVKVEDRGLRIHDDEIDMDGDDLEMEPGSDEEKAGSSKKKQNDKKEKDIFRGKKGKSGDDVDSDEEETFENMESKEVDYMSESSSEDELLEMDDEPDPEKENAGKAKDDLNLFMDSEDEEEKELDEAGKELKAILKKEAGEDASSDDDEEDEEEVDEDNIDNEFSSSAVFMQGKDAKKKKGRSGSTPSSKTGSRSNTPINIEQGASETLSQAANLLKEGKAAGSKRVHDSATPSPDSKKQKLSESPKTVMENIRTGSPSVRPGTPSNSGNGITEEAIRRYLTHKPMTTTDLMRKFKSKSKQTGLSKEQIVNTIATILKKIQPHQEKIDNTLYLSIKAKK